MTSTQKAKRIYAAVFGADAEFTPWMARTITDWPAWLVDRLYAEAVRGKRKAVDNETHIR